VVADEGYEMADIGGVGAEGVFGDFFLHAQEVDPFL